MSDTEARIIELDGKKYILLDSIVDNENTYYYFSNIEDNHDFLILKDSLENNEEVLIGIADDMEYDRVLELFLRKHQDVNLG